MVGWKLSLTLSVGVHVLALILIPYLASPLPRPSSHSEPITITLFAAEEIPDSAPRFEVAFNDQSLVDSVRDETEIPTKESAPTPYDSQPSELTETPTPISSPLSISVSPPAAFQPAMPAAEKPPLNRSAFIEPRTASISSRIPASNHQPSPFRGEGYSGELILAAPNYHDNPTPPYPGSARKRRQQGTVLLLVEVSNLGGAISVAVKRSSGIAILDRAAEAAVHSWKFTPARRGSTSVPCQVEIPIRFNLAD